MPTVVDELASERSLCQAVSCGDRFSCALTRTGRLFAWGRQGGATDAGTTVSRRARPPARGTRSTPPCCAQEYFVDSRVPVPIDFPGTATRIRSIGCYGAKVAAVRLPLWFCVMVPVASCRGSLAPTPPLPAHQLPGEPPSARGSTGPTPQRAVGSTGGAT